MRRVWEGPSIGAPGGEGEGGPWHKGDVEPYVAGEHPSVVPDVFRPAGSGELRPVYRRFPADRMLQQEPVRHDQQSAGPQKIDHAVVVSGLPGKPAVVVDYVIWAGERRQDCVAFAFEAFDLIRSEERRVGKECRL